MTIRIGYACINTQLQSTNRTCRLANATPERIIDLSRLNLSALAEILRWNQRYNVSLFRLSSDMIPFGSHPVNETRWWEVLAPELNHAADLIHRYEMRVSMHPGQFTVLNSPRQEVVEASMRELEYHAHLLDALGTDPSHRLILHLGGVYGDKAASMRRFVANFKRLRQRGPLGQSAAQRIVLENDEKNYTTADALALSNEIGSPVVFDVFHHKWNPSLETLSLGEILSNCAATWSPADGPPKIHYSDQWIGKQPGSHSQSVDIAAFGQFYSDILLPFTNNRHLDVMLEVKDKEQSVLALYKQFPNIHITAFRL
jgi:UV DNA damage endonuclease